jgi:hypothetical protein
MLTNVFDGSPKVLRCAFQTFRPICGNNGHFDVVWMAGAAFDPAQPPGQELSQYLLEDVGADLELPTDDWPYLYLQERGVSSFYLSLMVIFLLIALGSVFLASPELRAGFRSGRGIDAEMFLFGLAFLLIETKAVTEMNLVWGATWLTSAVVFGSILLMVLLGTIVMQVRPLPWWLGLSGLVITLIVGYITPTSTMVGLDLGPRLALSILFVGAPIFFASLCFALRFKQRQRPDIAFGWNLLGAVCGGLLELVSMAIGIKALFLVALGAYLGVALLRERAVRQPAQVTP